MTRLTLKIADRQLCNYQTFFVRSLWGKEFYICIQRTKSNLTLKDINGKTFDKCTMSDWFKSHDYFKIYWDKANRNEMIWTIICELRKELI